MSYKTYEKYKNSGIEWIGKIPNVWKIIKSKSIFKRYNKPSLTGKEELLSVSEYYGVKPKKETISNDEFITRAETLIGYKKCNKTDLVMNIMLAWKKGLGITDYEGIVSPSYEVFHTNKELVVPHFINYLLRTDLYATEFKRHSYGIIDSRLRLYPDNFKIIPFIIPPIEIQKQIADYLDKRTSEIDKNITKNKELILLLEEKKTSLINQVVTKGLDPNVPMKDSGIEWIGKIPEHWDILKLKHLCDTFGRIGFRGYNASDLVAEGEGAYTLGGKHIQKNKLDLSEPEFLSWEKYYESPEIMVRINDIIITQRGTLGKTVFIDKDIGPATINPSMILLKNISCYPKFLYYFLCSPFSVKNIELLNSQTAVPMISQEQANNFTIILPSNNEQKQIADYLNKKTSKIDKTISKIKENIDLLEEYKNSLIHHVVTGKIDVRGEEI